MKPPISARDVDAIVRAEIASHPMPDIECDTTDHAFRYGWLTSMIARAVSDPSEWRRFKSRLAAKENVDGKQ